MKLKKTYVLQVRTLPNAHGVLKVMAEKRGYRSVSALVRALLNETVTAAIQSGEITEEEMFNSAKDSDQ